MDKAPLCLLIYANVFSHKKKTFSSEREKISFCDTHRAKGDTGHSHSLQYSVHQHQTEITMPFPLKLGQSAHVRSSSIHQSLHAKVGLGSCDKRANEVVLGCFSASYPEVELSVSTLLEGIREGREATLDQLAHFGRNWLLFWDQMASPAACLQAEAKWTKHPMNV